jgi:hypothetical protein
VGIDVFLGHTAEKTTEKFGLAVLFGNIPQIEVKESLEQSANLTHLTLDLGILIDPCIVE